MRKKMGTLGMTTAGVRRKKELGVHVHLRMIVVKQSLAYRFVVHYLI